MSIGAGSRPARIRNRYPAQPGEPPLSLVPEAHGEGPDVHAHSVQFYADEEAFMNGLTRYIGSALGAGDAAIVIATRAHRDRLARQLKALGFDVALATRQDRYIALDATAALSAFMHDGWPDSARFTDLIAGVLGRAAQASKSDNHRIVAFGEMVALLCAEGLPEAAIELERLWNALAGTHTFELHCAYPLSFFGRAEDGKVMEQICAAHSQVTPAESYTSLVNDEERKRSIALLQQKALALATEIHEHKKLQQALERSEAELADLFDNAAVAIHWVGPDGIVLRANQAELSLLGYTREEYVGQHIARFHADQDALRDILDRLAGGETLHEVEARLRCKDGSIKNVLISSNVYWEDGKFVHTRCFTRDITDSKFTEAALRASEARFRTMADTVPVMVWVSDTDKRRTYFNKWWFEFTGRTFEQDQGFGWTEDLHPDDLKRYMDVYSASFDTRNEFRIEYRLKRYDGEYRWVLSHGVPFFSSDGAFVGFIGCSMDITERVQLEERKDAFIALASHELKTPITSLKIFTQLLRKRLEREGDGQAEMVKNLTRMDDQLDKLTALVRSLLDVSKIQAGKLDYTMNTVAVDDMLAEVVDEMRRISDTSEIELDANAAVEVNADEDRIRQVLMNLIMNAIKFSPKAGKIIVKSRLDKKGEQVTISVQDFGIGIPKSEQGKVFERFFQVGREDSSSQFTEGGKGLRADTYPGLGLGLYISAEIVARHGGRIWVESQVGHGSTFYFTLPV